MKKYNTDDSEDVRRLLRLKSSPSTMEYLPRRELYGSVAAERAGLAPMESVLDNLIHPNDYQDAIRVAHDTKTMPLYHCREWRPEGYQYNQGQLGYCWTWGGTGCIMTCRATKNIPFVPLAPVSMGYLVGWRNEGNYLLSFIRGAREQGICPAPDGNMNSSNRAAAHWNNVGRRNEFRLDKVWDTKSSAMTQQCISGLCAGRSAYIAYMWWGHAVELVGIQHNGSTMEWLISNSHNESDVIVLTGSRAVPSEAYFFVTTVFVP